MSRRTIILALFLATWVVWMVALFGMPRDWLGIGSLVVFVVAAVLIVRKRGREDRE
jgi:hypothetical protein